MLLTLYTIGVYMDRKGFAYPSQENIATGARTSVRTVQRHIAEAKHEGWIAAELAGRGGKGWRFTCYRACVPDHIDLDTLDEAIATAIQAQEGDIRDDTAMSSPNGNAHDTAMSSPNGNAHDTAMSSRPAPVQQRDDNGRGMVTTNGADGDDKSRTSWRHNSVVLTPALRTPAYKTHAREAQRFALSAPEVSSKREDEEPEVQQRKPSISDEDLLAQAYEAGQHCNHKVATIAKMLSGRYLDVTEDRLWRVIRTKQPNLSGGRA